MYGPTQGDPLIVSSGDGGWIHLAPQIAEFLGGRGSFVVGFDVRGYLESFTSARTSLQPSDEPGDYEALADFAGRRTGRRPILIGVSEGAGLSVLAATDARTKSRIAGVICLGLPDLNELAWRWKDALIYVTHGVPNEPLFSTAAIIGGVAPAPLAAIHSRHDEFVGEAQIRRIVDAAGEPKRLWLIDAADHRFSNASDELNRSLLDAIAWVDAHAQH